MSFFDCSIIKMVVGFRKGAVSLRTLALVMYLASCFKGHCLFKLFVHLKTFSFHVSNLVDFPFDALLLLSLFLISINGIDFELRLHFICKLWLLSFGLTTCFLNCPSLNLSLFMYFQHVHLLFLHLVSQSNNIHLRLLIRSFHVHQWLQYLEDPLHLQVGP